MLLVYIKLDFPSAMMGLGNVEHYSQTSLITHGINVEDEQLTASMLCQVD